MIIFDTETTGLVQANGTPVDKQPRMIEIAAIKVNPKMQETSRFETLIDPEIPIPAFITKITGISDKDVKGKPKFIEVYPKLLDMFTCERAVVAHNLSFDLNILCFALGRLGLELKFPWPSVHICTMEQTAHLCKTKKSFKMLELYEHAFGEKLIQQHRAMPDVEALLKIVKWMHKEKLLVK